LSASRKKSFFLSCKKTSFLSYSPKEEGLSFFFPREEELSLFLARRKAFSISSREEEITSKEEELVFFCSTKRKAFSFLF